MELTATTTVRKPAAEAYTFWRRFENLAEFMAHVDEVRQTGGQTSHWRASAPFGRTVEWDAEITEEVPGQTIAWRSLGEAEVPNSGVVRFVPAPDTACTEVSVHLVYEIPGGELGKAVAKYFGEEPHQQLDDDLRRFKQVLETGEVVRSDGAPWGKRARDEFPQRPARPLSPDERAEEEIA
ncbi:SRPBCC family protein [Krasilnikovia sp. MM14-A1004]|uniref:SRPBCC family protein n=1 Tax=Krasilnikovia sp. MM14-A1004 TaxID=3373541 RepID=UPI00399CCF6F